MLHYLISLLLILASSPAFCQNEGGSSYHQLLLQDKKNSDQIRTKKTEYLYRNPGWDSSWAFEEEKKTGKFWGLRLGQDTFEFQEKYLNQSTYLEGQFFLKASKSETYEIAAGFIVSKKEGAQKYSPTTKFRYSKSLNKKWSLALEHQQGLTSPESPTKLSILNLTSHQQIGVGSNYNTSTWRHSGKVLANYYSDQNSSNKITLAHMYVVSSWPWFLVGVNGEFLSFEQPSNEYWSPSRYWVFGPAVGFSYPVTKLTNLSTSISYNVHQEGDLAADEGWSGFSELSYGKRGDRFIAAGFNKIFSRQGDSSWWEQSLYLRMLFSI